MATSSIDSRSTSRSTSLPLRAERHADADLVGPPRDAVRHQPEQPDRRQQQREAAEQRVGLREELLLQEAPLDLLDLRRDVHHRQVRIDLPRPPRACRRWTLSGSPAVRTSNTALPTRVCRYGTYMRRRRRLAHAVVFGVAQHADDLELAAVLDARAEALADRVLVGKVLLRRRVVDDATFGAVSLSRAVKPRPCSSGISIISKKFGETTSRLMLSRWSGA